MPLWRVGELSARLGGQVEGEAERELSSVAGLAEAGASQLSFLSNRRYRKLLVSTRAGAVLVDMREPALPGRTWIRVRDPYAAFAQALQLFHPSPPLLPEVDPRACIGEGAVVSGARVEAFAWIGPGAVLGPGTWVESGAHVGAGARLGRDCRLQPGAVVCAGCTLGDRVWLNPGAVVGAEGYGFAPTSAGHIKIPQVGRAIIEDDVEIGANTCIDRAALGETRVRRGAKLDNLVQIGHAAEVGEHSLLVAFSGVAGSARLGPRNVLAARATVLGHLEMGAEVSVGVGGVVHDDQPDQARVSGLPAIPHHRWLEAVAVFGELPELARELRRLRARVAALEAPSQTPNDGEPT
jgi:UDP-3-O-[3-hydroxymyristoyl] glucosamine N-acyltransferase